MHRDKYFPLVRTAVRDKYFPLVRTAVHTRASTPRAARHFGSYRMRTARYLNWLDWAWAVTQSTLPHSPQAALRTLWTASKGTDFHRSITSNDSEHTATQSAGRQAALRTLWTASKGTDFHSSITSN